ncbi:ATP-binding protein [Marinicella meishanensis]|uniref:ATP-binding protein n=1 Tax=Marinicella meishanensis TaxID=2873263 RepID=UPI001CBD9494|nr:ATP-binding protein [Marinicella sp. NBU2979]
MDSQSDIKNMLFGSENETALFEAKRQINDATSKKLKFITTIISLANTATLKGQTAYFFYGVKEENGRLYTSGIDQDQIRDPKEIHDLVNDQTLVNNFVNFECKYININSHTILRIEIPPQNKLIYRIQDLTYFHDKLKKVKLNKNVIYYRDGPRLSQLSPDEILDYSHNQINPSFEFSLIDWDTKEKLDFKNLTSIEYRHPNESDFINFLGRIITFNKSNFSPAQLLDHAIRIKNSKEYHFLSFSVKNIGNAVGKNIHIKLRFNNNFTEVLLSKDLTLLTSTSQLRTPLQNSVIKIRNETDFTEVSFHLDSLSVDQTYIANDFIAVKFKETGNFSFSASIVCDEFRRENITKVFYKNTIKIEKSSAQNIYDSYIQQ